MELARDATFTLTAVDNTADGATGLPVIAAKGLALTAGHVGADRVAEPLPGAGAALGGHVQDRGQGAIRGLDRRARVAIGVRRPPATSDASYFAQLHCRLQRVK